MQHPGQIVSEQRIYSSLYQYIKHHQEEFCSSQQLLYHTKCNDHDHVHINLNFLVWNKHSQHVMFT